MAVAALSFLVSNFDKITLAHQVIDSASICRQNSSPQAFETMNKIRGIFDTISSSFAIANYMHLAALAAKNSRFVHIILIDSLAGGFHLAAMGAIAGAVPFVLVSLGIVHLVNKYFAPTKNSNELLVDIPKEQLQDIKVSWDKSTSQQFTQALLGIRIIMEVALACFTANPIYLAAAAFQVYNLVVTARWHWMRYEFSIVEPSVMRENAFGIQERQPLYSTINAIRFVYFRSMIPASGYKNEDCAVCIEPNDTSSRQSCSQHAMHDTCLTGVIHSKIKRLYNLAFWLRTIKLKERFLHTKNYVPTHYSWEIEVSKEILPDCPNCRDQSGFGEIEIYTKENVIGMENGFVKAKLIYV